MENQLVSYDDFSNKITVDRIRQILTYSKCMDSDKSWWIDMTWYIVIYCDPVEFANSHPVCNVSCLPQLHLIALWAAQ